MEGKMPLFHVPVLLGVQKHCFPTSTSAALQSQAQHRRAKIDLPPKVSEVTQMATSYASPQHVCIYSNVPAQRKMYLHSVFMPLSNALANHPQCSCAGSRQPTHLCYDILSDPCPDFMCLLIASVYSETSWETDGGGGLLEQATGTQGETDREGRRGFTSIFVSKWGNASYSSPQPWQRTANICFLSYFSKPLAVWLIFKYRWMLSPLIEPYRNRPERISTDGEERWVGKRGSGFIRTAQGLAMSWLGHLMENERTRKQKTKTQVKSEIIADSEVFGISVSSLCNIW